MDFMKWNKEILSNTKLSITKDKNFAIELYNELELLMGKDKKYLTKGIIKKHNQEFSINIKDKAITIFTNHIFQYPYNEDRKWQITEAINNLINWDNDLMTDTKWQKYHDKWKNWINFNFNIVIKQYTKEIDPVKPEKISYKKWKELAKEVKAEF